MRAPVCAWSSLIFSPPLPMIRPAPEAGIAKRTSLARVSVTNEEEEENENKPRLDAFFSFSGASVGTALAMRSTSLVMAATRPSTAPTIRATRSAVPGKRTPFCPHESEWAERKDLRDLDACGRVRLDLGDSSASLAQDGANRVVGDEKLDGGL
jgi:hypothetical protein